MGQETVLVSGGAGFIGSALVRYLIAQTTLRVITLDKLTYAGSLQALESAQKHPRHVFIKADICDSAMLTQVFQRYQPTAVIHLAAESHVDRSVAAPQPFIQSNIVGTYALLEASRAHWAGLRKPLKQVFRFLHVSTDEVYGDLGNTGGFFTEASPYAPSSPYSASKAAADHLVRAWHRTYDLPILISNCSNNYGPWQYPEKLIPATIRRALNKQAIQIYGDGRQVRDWLHVDDHVRALWLQLQHGQIGQTYLLGSGQPQSNLAVVVAICELLDELKPLALEALPQPTAHTTRGAVSTGRPSYKQYIQFVKDRPGHDRRYAIDATKVKKQLGWQSQYDFHAGLRETVLWYLRNPAWLKQQ
ncbi:MAG TPA: dTDP-glucose 4,6-dehydratase [Burkholderiaceae bacterium]|nr:dTDP-glucose 4,6-dehydratase [Burkholderiaceae bacterium]